MRIEFYRFTKRGSSKSHQTRLVGRVVTEFDNVNDAPKRLNADAPCLANQSGPLTIIIVVYFSIIIFIFCRKKEIIQELFGR